MRFLHTFLLSVLLLTASLATSQAAPRPPNYIVLFCNDLGDQGQAGAHQRPAGHVSDPRPLTR